MDRSIRVITLVHLVAYIFALLKWANVLDLSWWWISPVWISWAFIFLVILTILAFKLENDYD